MYVGQTAGRATTSYTRFGRSKERTSALDRRLARGQNVRLSMGKPPRRADTWQAVQARRPGGPGGVPAPERLGASEAVFVSLLVISPLLYAWVLHLYDPNLYYLSLQEDEFLEWATFWAFLLGAGAFALLAVRQRRATDLFPWFALGVSLFCFLVAMEEISWAQRLLGYRAPEYFLEHNYQQELNLHNVVSSDLRQEALALVILGFGAVLPLAGLWPGLRRRLSGVAVVMPPAAIVPAFLVTFALYQVYPWQFSGEVVEMMLGAGMLVAGFTGLSEFRPDRTVPVAPRRMRAVAAASLAVVALGLSAAWGSRSLRTADPTILAQATTELDALRQDFTAIAGRDSEQGPGCGLSRRIHTYVERSRERALQVGAFSRLAAQGMPEERAAFFIDPWNQPYWIRDECSADARVRRVFVYSLGPNRRRDSSAWDILGDDVGAWIYRSEGDVPVENQDAGTAAQDAP